MTSALGFKARVDPSLACFLASMFLRFTSGVTPADCTNCMQIRMAAEPFQSTYLPTYPQARFSLGPNSGPLLWWTQHCVPFGHSSQWWIQDFPKEGALTPKGGGANLLFGQFFPKTAWKWRNFGPMRSATASSVQSAFHYLHNIKFWQEGVQWRCRDL